MKNAQSLTHLTKKLGYGNRLHPTRDWFVLLTFAIVLFVLGIAWNIFLFTQFENAKAPGDLPAIPSEQDVGNSVSKVQTLFQARAAEEGNYQHLYQFVDPSLPGS